jgi:hypothetical protein
MSTNAKCLVLGEFDSAKDAVRAIEALKAKSVLDLELYSPYPVPEAYDLLEIKRSPMPALILCGAIIGGMGGLALQLWCNGIVFPINIGGKPLFSIPSSIPITFETTILCGGLTAFFGLWAVLKLPRLHHPVFEVPHFGSSAVNHCWLSIATDPGELNVTRARQALEEAGAKRVETIDAKAGDQ